MKEGLNPNDRFPKRREVQEEGQEQMEVVSGVRLAYVKKAPIGKEGFLPYSCRTGI